MHSKNLLFGFVLSGLFLAAAGNAFAGPRQICAKITSATDIAPMEYEIEKVVNERVLEYVQNAYPCKVCPRIEHLKAQVKNPETGETKTYYLYIPWNVYGSVQQYISYQIEQNQGHDFVICNLKDNIRFDDFDDFTLDIGLSSHGGYDGVVVYKPNSSVMMLSDLNHFLRPVFSNSVKK